MIVFFYMILSFLAATSVTGESVGSMPLVLRDQPVALLNPDGRCVRNALLQAIMPMIIDSINLNAQRTGVVLDDATLVGMITGDTMNRHDVVAATLMRSVLACNQWSTDLPAGDNVYHNVSNLVYYGDGSRQYPLIMADIMTGLAHLTAARVAYCQLPVDRCSLSLSTDLLSDKIGTSIEHARDEAPDYIVVDTSGSHTAQLDQYSLVSKESLSLPNENSIPTYITVTCGDDSSLVYEMVSFCNVERSGIPRRSTILSRFMACARHIGCLGMVPHNTLPIRHATAVVRYHDRWFVAEDSRIWEVHCTQDCTPHEIGALLMSYYPGTRVLVVYKRVVADDRAALRTTSGASAPRLILNKVSLEAPLLLERPMVHLGLGTLTTGIACASIVSLVHAYQCMEPVPGHQAQFTRAWLTRLIFPQIVLPLLGQTTLSIFNYWITKRMAAQSIELSAQTRGATGLYSDLSEQVCVR